MRHTKSKNINYILIILQTCDIIKYKYFYKNIDEIRQNHIIEKQFVPKMQEEEKERKVKAWNKAVKRALAWKDDEED